MDKFGDHAAVCPCKGDRTVRHNALCNLCQEDAVAGGSRAEREKLGLLPARPSEDDLPGSSQNRRPADVWLPQGTDGRSEALDFAVTSGMRADRLHRSTTEPGSVLKEYELFKKTYKDTGQQCEQAGFRFTPMVLEAHGGSWSPVARQVFDRLAKRAAAATGEEPSLVSLRIAQRTSVALHRENARAILKRLTTLSVEEPKSGWDEAAAEADELWQ